MPLPADNHNYKMSASVIAFVSRGICLPLLIHWLTRASRVVASSPYLRMLSGGVAATLTMYCIAGPGLLNGFGYLAFFFAGIAAGLLAGRNPASGAYQAFAVSSALLVIASAVSWSGALHINRLLMSPFILIGSLFSASSGMPLEILVFAAALSLPAAGGAAGSIICQNLPGPGRKLAELERVRAQEIERLMMKKRKLDEEWAMIEEELRVCDVMEQGAKTRIARNEMTQEDYDSAISNNERYRASLRTKAASVETDLKDILNALASHGGGRENDPAEAR